MLCRTILHGIWNKYYFNKTVIYVASNFHECLFFFKCLFLIQVCIYYRKWSIFINNNDRIELTQNDLCKKLT